MEALADSFAELGSMILTLREEPSTPEFDGQVLCLTQKFAALQEVVNDILKSMNEEIADLHKQIGKLEAEKIGLEKEFSTTERTRKYDELCAALESRNAKNEKLEAEEKILKEQVKTVEHQIMELKDDLQQAKRETDREIKNLKDKLDDVKEENQTHHRNALASSRERRTLRKDVWDLKESVHKLNINTTILQKKVEDLDRKIHEPDDDLIFGELCRRVQSMIFQKILPPGFYDDRESYEIKSIDESLRLLFKDDEHKINEANQAWTELQKELKWQETDVERMVSMMEMIQEGKNVAAHPELTEVILAESIQRIKHAGRLETIMELDSVWKQLMVMA